jgi:hypothetical protein
MSLMWDEGHANASAKSLDDTACGSLFERYIATFHRRSWSTFRLSSSHSQTIGNTFNLCGFASR